MDYFVKINLSKLRKVEYYKRGDELFIGIPVKKNNIFNGQKGFYLEATAYTLKEPKYNETHLLKFQVTEEQYKQLTDDQKQRIPIIGSLSPLGMKDLKVKEAVQTMETPANVEPEEDYDLPF